MSDPCPHCAAMATISAHRGACARDAVAALAQVMTDILCAAEPQERENLVALYDRVARGRLDRFQAASQREGVTLQ